MSGNRARTRSNSGTRSRRRQGAQPDSTPASPAPAAAPAPPPPQQQQQTTPPVPVSPSATPAPITSAAGWWKSMGYDKQTGFVCYAIIAATALIGVITTPVITAEKKYVWWWVETRPHGMTTSVYVFRPGMVVTVALSWIFLGALFMMILFARMGGKRGNKDKDKDSDTDKNKDKDDKALVVAMIEHRLWAIIIPTTALGAGLGAAIGGMQVIQDIVAAVAFYCIICVVIERTARRLTNDDLPIPSGVFVVAVVFTAIHLLMAIVPTSAVTRHIALAHIPPMARPVSLYFTYMGAGTPLLYGVWVMRAVSAAKKIKHPDKDTFSRVSNVFSGMSVHPLILFAFVIDFVVVLSMIVMTGVRMHEACFARHEAGAYLAGSASDALLSISSK